VRDARKVFVVHGRNVEARKALFSFLRSISLVPIELAQAINMTEKASPYLGEVLDAAFSYAQAVVVLMTPDDEARLLSPYRAAGDPDFEQLLTPQARPNVLFEAGMAMGRDSNRTVLIEVGKLRPFSDIGGRHVVRLNNSLVARQSIANRLKQAGCPVDLTGVDWHSEGDFDSVVSSSVSEPNEFQETRRIDVNAIFARLSHLAVHDDFFLHYEIPTRVRRRAYELFVPHDEEILAFLDTTEGLSGRNGIAFTNSGLFWRNPRETESNLSWADLFELPILASDRTHEVRISEYCLDLTNSEVLPSHLMLALRDIVSMHT
jgi:hypothetical protein